MIEAGKDIQRPFYQAIAEDLVSKHDLKNFVGPFTFTLGYHSIGYIYAVYGPGKIDIVDDWNGQYTIVLDDDRTFFKFPIKVYPEGIITVETNENTLTQILVKDEY